MKTKIFRNDVTIEYEINGQWLDYKINGIPQDSSNIHVIVENWLDEVTKEKLKTKKEVAIRMVKSIVEKNIANGKWRNWPYKKEIHKQSLKWLNDFIEIYG